MQRATAQPVALLQYMCQSEAKRMSARSRTDFLVPLPLPLPRRPCELPSPQQMQVQMIH
jgi:hypothetical protein